MEEKNKQLKLIQPEVAVGLIQNFNLVFNRPPGNLPIRSIIDAIKILIQCLEKLTWNTVAPIDRIKNVIDLSKELKNNLDREFTKNWIYLAYVERVSLRAVINDLKESNEDLDLVFNILPNDKEFQEINSKLSDL